MAECYAPTEDANESQSNKQQEKTSIFFRLTLCRMWTEEDKHDTKTNTNTDNMISFFLLDSNKIWIYSDR